LSVSRFETKGFKNQKFNELSLISKNPTISDEGLVRPAGLPAVLLVRASNKN